MNEFLKRKPLRSGAVLGGAAACVALVYAVVRYNIFNGVAWSHLPLFVGNKAVSFASIMLIAGALVVGMRRREKDRTRSSTLAKTLGMAGFCLILMHGVMSTILISPTYYPNLYDEAKLNFVGELSIFLGVGSLFLFLPPMATSFSFIEQWLEQNGRKKARGVVYVALAFVGGHVLVMGLEGWFKPAEWPGGLPSISMLSFVIILVPLALKVVLVRSRRRRENSPV